MTRPLSFVVPLLLACGGSKPAPREPQVAAAIDCHVVAEHGVGVESSSQDLVAKTKTTVAASCEKNAWSEDSKRCIVGATTDEARSRCIEMLTDPQRDALKADLTAAFQGQPGVTVQDAAAAP